MHEAGAANPFQRATDLFFAVKQHHQTAAFREVLAGLKTGEQERSLQFGKLVGTGG